MEHIRRIRVKIFSPGNKGFMRKTLAAAPGQAFTEAGIERILDQVAETIDKLHPAHEYSMVQVDVDAFNFVWRAEKAAAA
jgi:hypothetical protein